MDIYILNALLLSCLQKVFRIMISVITSILGKSILQQICVDC